MEIMMKDKTAKINGFTLIEMLIVIVIIGILAAMILMGGRSAVDKAEATKIISDLRTMKSAIVMYYVDYGSWPVWASAGSSYTKGASTEVYPTKYVEKLPAGENYWIGAMTLNSSLAFSVAGVGSLDVGVRKALASQAEQNHLYGLTMDRSSMGKFSEESNRAYYTESDTAVVMIVGK